MSRETRQYGTYAQRGCNARSESSPILAVEAFCPLKYGGLASDQIYSPREYVSVPKCINTVDSSNVHAPSNAKRWEMDENMMTA
jgi:hypothetical protein